MSFAIISDVHSNEEALSAVLEDIEKRGVEEIYFLGDAVGYGPDPNECIKLLRKKCTVLLAGNHDWAVLGLTEVAYFNDNARAAVKWTDDVITDRNRKALNGFPLVKAIEEKDLFLVHAAPYEPEDWHYLFSPLQAVDAFNYFKQRICVVGHSHVPFIAEETSEGKIVPHERGIKFRKGSRYVINVGSVGQPRDGDPRACYALFENNGVQFVRVKYDIDATQKKMEEAGLPAPLILRLSVGR